VFSGCLRGVCPASRERGDRGQSGELGKGVTRRDRAISNQHAASAQFLHQSELALLRSTKQEIRMRLLLAIILPWFQFFTIGRPFAGIICLILQITLIGWIPAAIWSVYALSQYNTDKKISRALGNGR
jgi:hypothetical protein